MFSEKKKKIIPLIPIRVTSRFKLLLHLKNYITTTATRCCFPSTGPTLTMQVSMASIVCGLTTLARLPQMAGVGFHAMHKSPSMQHQGIIFLLLYGLPHHQQCPSVFLVVDCVCSCLLPTFYNLLLESTVFDGLLLICLIWIECLFDDRIKMFFCILLCFKTKYDLMLMECVSMGVSHCLSHWHIFTSQLIFVWSLANVDNQNILFCETPFKGANHVGFTSAPITYSILHVIF